MPQQCQWLNALNSTCSAGEDGKLSVPLSQQGSFLKVPPGQNCSHTDVFAAWWFPLGSCLPGGALTDCDGVQTLQLTAPCAVLSTLLRSLSPCISGWGQRTPVNSRLLADFPAVSVSHVKGTKGRHGKQKILEVSLVYQIGFTAVCLVRFEPHRAFSWGNRALFALILCYPSNPVIFNLVSWVALAPVGAVPYVRAHCPAPCTRAMSHCKLINWCTGFYITLLWIWINTKSPE